MALLLKPTDLLGGSELRGAQRGDISVLVRPKKEIDEIIKAGHYSGTVVWSSNTHLGVYYRGSLIGAMQLGPAMNPRSGHKIVDGATPDTWQELNRLWLDDARPDNTASQAIACAFQIVRNLRPEVEWIQSFADERCGKLGAVYQACSFDYLGFHRSEFFKIDDTWIHKSMLTRKQVDKRGWKQGPKVKWAQENAHRAVAYTFNQYRYVKFLRPGARRRLLKPVLPYPKPLHAVTCNLDEDCTCHLRIAA